MPFELSDNSSSKWAKMGDEIISSTKPKSNRASKRIQSPNVNNKWRDERKKTVKEKN